MKLETWLILGWDTPQKGWMPSSFEIIAELVIMWVTLPVWPGGIIIYKIFRHFCINLSLGQYLEVLFAICDNFETVLAAFKCSWAHFNCCRWENTKKYKWAIWSHWIGGSVDLSALTKLRSWVRIPSRPSCFNISQILCCLCHWVENWTKVNKK